MPRGRRNEDLSFEIIRNYGAISEKPSGWKREINIVSWGDGEPKFDIRDWSPDHTKMGKGITLTEEEMMNLIEIAKSSIFNENDNEDDLFEEKLLGMMTDNANK